jgi:hypothetical protein
MAHQIVQCHHKFIYPTGCQNECLSWEEEAVQGRGPPDGSALDQVTGGQDMWSGGEQARWAGVVANASKRGCFCV